MTTVNRRQTIREAIEHHVEAAVSLASLRRQRMNAPNVSLSHLSQLDEELSMHLDGIASTGENGWRRCEAELASESDGSLFTAAVIAIESDNDQRLQALLELAESSPRARPGFLGALCWVSTDLMRQVGSVLLSSANPFWRHAGIVGCAMHGLDPGLILSNAVKSPEAPLRARALRAAGELGRRDLINACTAAARDGDATCRFWGAWSSVRLGCRGVALDLLLDMYRTPGFFAERDATLALLAMELPRAHATLSDISRDPGHVRMLIEGAGLVGDSVYVPWLIEQMAQEPFSRVAGEAFTLITGADLQALQLARHPEDFSLEAGADEGLPWPDPEKVSVWWRDNRASFTSGVRMFMGAPLSAESCLNVLKEGYQRQRRTAALHRALQNPIGPLFECRAPASQQRRRLM
jgi:uncharacterized protein (TIGR02270 family)